MKDNYVILYEIEHDSKHGYEIAINTHLGVFVGYTEADEIDARYPSSYHASEIALAKALRKFAEAATAQLKREINLIENMMKQVTDNAFDYYDVDNSSFRTMNGTLKQKRKEYERWSKRVSALSESIINRVAARDKIVAKYMEKDKKD